MEYNYTDINKKAAELYGEEYIDNKSEELIEEKSQETKKKKIRPSKKVIIIGIIVLIIVAVIFTIVIKHLKNNDYEAPIKEQFELLNEGEFDYTTYHKYVVPKPTFENENAYIDLGVDIFASEVLNDTKESDYHELIGNFGEEYIVTYEILSAKKLDYSELSELQEKFEESFIPKTKKDSSDYVSLQYTFDLSKDKLEKLEQADKKYYKEIEKCFIRQAYSVKIVVITLGKDADSAFVIDTFSMQIGDDWITDVMFDSSLILENHYSFNYY